jgi:hypothetical protein
LLWSAKNDPDAQKAFKENPLLEREHAPARQEAERLLAEDRHRSR